jgi:outer membrane protein OmpA-like peptidoglycan-associated protein
MTILAMLPWRSHGGVCANDRARRHASCLVLAVTLAGLGDVMPAQAQSAAARPSVEVDLGALDTLSPPPPGTPPSRIRLHMPETAAKPPTANKQTLRSGTPAPSSPPATAPTAMTEPPPSPGKAVTPPPPPHLPPPPVGADASPTAAPSQRLNATSAVVGPVADRILFAVDTVKLPDEAKAELDQLAKRLSADEHLYVQLVGYAGGETDASQARRISLSRALAARSYLVDQGVQIKQVDVRPLGNKTDPGTPPDRVDLVVAER